MDEIFHRSIPFFALLAVWLFAFIGIRHKRARNEARRDVQLALLNKFQTGEEMTKFLATEEGRRLLDQLSGPVEDLHHKTVGLVVGSSVLLSIGIAFGVLAYAFGTKGFIVAGSVIGAAGLGLVMGAAVANRISRKLGSRQDN